VAHSIPAQDQEAILIGWSDALADFGVTGADFYAVRFAAGQESTARPALDKMATSYALEPNDLDRVSGTVGDALDRIFRLLDALALIAVLVAGLGMVNTFSMSVFERIREIGVLRATGMTSRQVWGMVVIEAGVLGVIGSIIGAAVGLLVGALLVAGRVAALGSSSIRRGLRSPWPSASESWSASSRPSIRRVWPAGYRSSGRSNTNSIEPWLSVEAPTFGPPLRSGCPVCYTRHHPGPKWTYPVVPAPQPRRRRINDACSRPTS